MPRRRPISRPRTKTSKCQMPDCLRSCVLNACACIYVCIYLYLCDNTNKCNVTKQQQQTVQPAAACGIEAQAAAPQIAGLSMERFISHWTRIILSAASGQQHATTTTNPQCKTTNRKVGLCHNEY